MHTNFAGGHLQELLLVVGHAIAIVVRVLCIRQAIVIVVHIHVIYCAIIVRVYLQPRRKGSG